MEMEMDRFDILSYIWHQLQDLNEVDGVKRAHFDQSENLSLNWEISQAGDRGAVGREL